VRRHVGLSDDLGRKPAFVAIGKDARGDVVVLDRARPVHELQPDVLEASENAVLLLGVEAGVEVERLRPHAGRADHQGGQARDGLNVTTDAARRLSVEDALSRHRAEAPDQRRHLVGAPLAEALDLLGRLVMPERLAAHPNRDPGRLGALHVDVARRGVAGLVERDRPRVRLRILDVDGGPRLDGRHRLEDVGRVEPLAPVGMRVGQRH